LFLLLFIILASSSLSLGAHYAAHLPVSGPPGFRMPRLLPVGRLPTCPTAHLPLYKCFKNTPSQRKSALRSHSLKEKKAFIKREI